MQKSMGKLKSLTSYVSKKIPDSTRHTVALRAFGFFKIPMLFFLSPRVRELSEKQCIVEIPLTFRSKNHLNSMYFAALAAGADCCIGLLAFHAMDQLNCRHKIQLIFKDFKAEFLQRAQDDVQFICTQGPQIAEFVKKVLNSNERMNMTVPAIAIVPSQSATEPVAKFELTLSLKKKS